jgi:hypothetical protein
LVGGAATAWSSARGGARIGSTHGQSVSVAFVDVTEYLCRNREIKRNHGL